MEISAVSVYPTRKPMCSRLQVPSPNHYTMEISAVSVYRTRKRMGSRLPVPSPNHYTTEISVVSVYWTRKPLGSRLPVPSPNHYTTAISVIRVIPLIWVFTKKSFTPIIIDLINNVWFFLCIHIVCRYINLCWIKSLTEIQISLIKELFFFQ